MRQSRKSAPSMAQIAAAWRDCNPSRLVDADRLGTQCWACGSDMRDLQRAHIVPHCAGGGDSETSNYFLLCWVCHKEQPDIDRWAATLRSAISYLETAITCEGLDPSLWEGVDVKALAHDAASLDAGGGASPGNIRSTRLWGVLDRFLVMLR